MIDQESTEVSEPTLGVAKGSESSGPKDEDETGMEPVPEADAVPGALPGEQEQLQEQSEEPEQVKEPQSDPPAAKPPVEEPVRDVAPPAQEQSEAPKPVVTKDTTTTEKSSSETSEPSKLSFKDRLAAFNQPGKPGGPGSNAEGARSPPPLKPKPMGMTWSERQKIKEEEEKKRLATQGDAGKQEASPAPAPAATNQPDEPASVTASASTSKEESNTGMSASDAKASIGMSLKERMAALSGNQAFGGGGAAAAPSKPNEEGEKRPTKTWKRPEAPPGQQGALPLPGQMPAVPGRAVKSPEPGESTTGQDQGSSEDAAANDDAVTTGEPSSDQPPPDQEGENEDDEEQKAKEKRAAIAARMAKLGGRGMFALLSSPRNHLQSVLNRQLPLRPKPKSQRRKRVASWRRTPLLQRHLTNPVLQEVELPCLVFLNGQLDLDAAGQVVRLLPVLGQVRIPPPQRQTRPLKWMNQLQSRRPPRKMSSLKKPPHLKTAQTHLKLTSPMRLPRRPGLSQNKLDRIRRMMNAPVSLGSRRSSVGDL